MALAIQSPVVQFFDLDGSPLDAGYLYFGTAGQNPETNPVTVYWDSAATQPAAQPIRTMNGYPARMGQIATVYAVGDYSMTVKNSRGQLVKYAATSAEFSNDASLQSQITALSTDLASNATGDGADLVGFSHAATYLQGTVGLALQAFINVKNAPYNAKGDGVTNDTAAIQDAIDDIAAAGGGVVYFPPGVYMVTGISKLLAIRAAVILRGAGKFATTIRKISGSATVLALSGLNTALDVYGGIEDLTIDGVDKSGPGLGATNICRFFLTRAAVRNSSVGIENLGSLCFLAIDPLLNDNGIGYRCRKANGIFPNLVEFHGGDVRSNTTFGFDLGDGQAIVLRGTDISGNGTTGDVNTGGVIVRETIDDETGFGQVVLDGVWLEASFGTAFRAEAISNGHITLEGVTIYSTEKIAGVRNDINIGAVRTSILRNVLAPTSDAGTTTIAANNSVIEGGQFQVLNDTSTHRRHNTRTAAGVQINRVTQTTIMGASGQEMLVADNFVVSGLSANDTTFYKFGTGRLRFQYQDGTVPLSLEPGKVGFFSSNPVVKPAITGSRGGNAALASLLTQLEIMGLITNSTS